MANGRLDRYLIAAQLRVRRGVDTTMPDVVAIRRYAGLPDDGGPLNYVLNRVLRRVNDVDEFDAEWLLARQQAESERAQEQLRQFELEEQRKQRRRELSARPRKPCPYCGRKTPLEICRKCESGCEVCGRLTPLRDPIGLPRCAGCEYKLTISRTKAKQKYKLTDVQLESLLYVERVNPYHRSGPPMRLYDVADVVAIAGLAPPGSQ